jgi:hypothetical protein
MLFWGNFLIGHDGTENLLLLGASQDFVRQSPVD